MGRESNENFHEAEQGKNSVVGSGLVPRGSVTPSV